MVATGEKDTDSSGVEYYTAPSGGVTKGQVYQISGGIIVVAMETADAAAEFMGCWRGRVRCTKTATTGITFEKGDYVYYDDTNKVVTNASTGNTLIGFAAEAVATYSTATVLVDLVNQH